MEKNSHRINFISIVISLFLLCSTDCYADINFSVDGICYYCRTGLTSAYVTFFSTDSESNSSRYYGIVTIPKKVTYSDTDYSVNYIGTRAFKGCSNLSNVIIPTSITKIYDDAFYNCSSIDNIEIPSSVTSIGSRAFSTCSSLKTITLPESLTEISTSTFYNCTSLESIDIPSNVTSIGSSAFSGCTSLIDVVLPSGLTDIESSLFLSCSSLKSIDIPEGVTSISNQAFKNCSSLVEIDIPNSVTNISNYAFYGCVSLSEISIPNSVTLLNIQAFYGCSNLTTLYLGTGLSKIYKEVFSGCTSLSDIYCYATTPPTCSNSSVFDSSTYSSAILHVPVGTSSDYASATAWKNFYTIIEDIDAGINEVNVDNCFGEISVSCGRITISGYKGDIKLYGIGGMLYSLISSDGSPTSITTPGSGTYILEIGKESRKIYVK